MTQRMRTYNELADEDRSKLMGQVIAQRDKVRERLASVRHVVAVMSGKGGVGKSFVTAALAAELARRAKRVGVLDADLHGPTAARMLGVSGQSLEVRAEGVMPALADNEVRVMSTDLLLPEGAPLQWREPEHEGFVWHGALEAGMLREFLGDVVWGELDVLLIDLPPGTERLTALHELVPQLAGVVVVTIPSDASRRAVERAAQAALALHVSVLGVVENMAGYRCPACAVVSPLFEGNAALAITSTTGAPLLASIPFDPEAQAAADRGHSKGTGRIATEIRELADGLLDRVGSA